MIPAAYAVLPSCSIFEAFTRLTLAAPKRSEAGAADSRLFKRTVHAPIDECRRRLRAATPDVVRALSTQNASKWKGVGSFGLKCTLMRWPIHCAECAW